MKPIIVSKLHTRQQIIDIWKSQPEEIKNNYCCPNCRDLLVQYADNIYTCNNDYCQQPDMILKEYQNEI